MGSKSLRHLNLAHCGVEQENIPQLTAALKSKKLEHLNLAHNALGKDSGTLLGNVMSQLDT
jgi:Ran GTPase-activating protein (RanGAP) involved in mRNA processing and transport